MLSIREDHAIAAWPWIAETGAVGKQNDLLDCAGFHRFVLPTACAGFSKAIERTGWCNMSRKDRLDMSLHSRIDDAISGTTDADNRNLKKER